MFLKLNNNPKLANPITGTIVDNVAGSIDKLFIKNCPLLDGYANLKKIYDVQSDNGSIVLSRVRVDIGNVSGSISELIQYSSMAGFNDAGEEQVKPRLVGTWTVNDWYTQEQIAAAQAAFDGLTIVPNTNYLINFNDLAVQVLDPNEDNYNPAVAIVLQGQNLGTTMTAAPLGHGRWFLTKTQAAAITSMITGTTPWFYIKTTVVDSNAIVTSDASISYDFSSFDEFQYFGVTSVGEGAFQSCSSLETITLPSGLLTIGRNAFRNCTNLKMPTLPTSITTIGQYAFLNACSGTPTQNELVDINLPNLTTFSSSDASPISSNKYIRKIISLGSITSLGGDFGGCTNLIEATLPSTITTFSNAGLFNGIAANAIIHLLSETPITIPYSYYIFRPSSVKVYVGDGSSSTHDDAILADYLATSNWSYYSSQLDTWYNYLHPQS